VIETLAEVGGEIELLAGRSFQPARRKTSVFEPNGLPFVDLPDLLIGATEPIPGVWAIPDPVNPQMATVLQVAPLADPVPNLRYSA